MLQNLPSAIDWQPQSLAVIRTEIARYDFAVVNFGYGDSNQLNEMLFKFAREANLGTPYIPCLYTSNEVSSYSTSFGLNDVGGPSSKMDHPAFSQSGELDFHVDGTLESIGAIRTTVLACVQPAMTGGETLILRACAALEDACSEDTSPFEPLFDKRALRRHTTIKDRNEHNDGPVFAFDAGKLVGRYCVSAHDEWRFEVVPGLREARQALEDVLKTRANMRHEIALAAGQVLIMNNSRVSHGRREFCSFADSPRHLLRGLFCSGL